MIQASHIMTHRMCPEDTAQSESEATSRTEAQIWVFVLNDGNTITRTGPIS